MKQYSVILNFTFEPHGCDVQVEYDDDGNEIPMKPQDQAKFDAFERTDRFFEKNDIVKYIKNRCDAYSFVQNCVSINEVISAYWLKDKFAIEMFIDANATPDEIEDDLQSTSLEDGEYEACCDTGWVVMTRGPKGECFGDDGNWEMRDHYFEYGLTDYRQNEIIIKQIGDKPDPEEESILFVPTQRGLNFHKRMGNLKMQGVKLSNEEEENFKILCKLLNDPQMYPVN
jgi:hypothetical protein